MFKSSYNKYHNTKFVDSNGVTWDSKLEFNHSGYLNIMEKAGRIKEVNRQVRIKLGKSDECKVHYVADFTYFDMQRGKWVVCDVKGFETPEFKLKMKWLLDTYTDFLFEVVKARGKVDTYAPYGSGELQMKEAIKQALAKKSKGKGK